MTDARFRDGAEAPLSLLVHDQDDLTIASALVQDAVFGPKDVTRSSARREFALLINRFRWEDADDAKAQGRPFERVRSLLVIQDVLAVQSVGITRDDSAQVLSLLTLDFTPSEDGAGVLMLTMAEGASLRLEVEALNLVLRDVTRPYAAPSGKEPAHE